MPKYNNNFDGGLQVDLEELIQIELVNAGATSDSKIQAASRRILLEIIKAVQPDWVGKAKPDQWAKVCWTANDIQTLAKKWPLWKCYEWLRLNETNIQDELIKFGWDTLDGWIQAELREAKNAKKKANA